MDESLAKVLAAREQRWERRLGLVQMRHKCLITITLCLPVAFRTQEKYAPLFEHLCVQFRSRLADEGILTDFEGMLRGDDGPAYLMTTETDAAETKKHCVDAEERIPGGRMLDIDVMDAEGNPIGRSEVGLPPRQCFLCDNPAAVCVAGKRHSRDEIAAYAVALIEQATPKG